MLSSEALAKELVGVFLQNFGDVHIIVDGLDECEKAERKKIISWLRSVNGLSQRTNSCHMRCVFVSQRDEVSTKALHDLPTVEIKPGDIRDDILVFVKSLGMQIKEKFQISEDAMESMIESVTKKAEGESF